MATTYTSTLQIKCLKEHTCIQCGGTFAYLFERKITGTGGSAVAASTAAEKNAHRAITRDVDMHPCPHCGLYQPDMVGTQRANGHFWLAWLLVGYFVLLVILQVSGVVSVDKTIWLATASAIVALLANLIIDLRNPNHDLAANLELGERRHAAGKLHVGVPSESQEQNPEWCSPAWTTFHRLAMAILFLTPLLVVLPEAIRIARGWPVNSAWHPPVVGPGDEAYVYLDDSIQCLKGLWTAHVTIAATVVDQPNAAPIHVSARSNDSNWGDRIHVKSSEKNSSSRLWYSAQIPHNAELENKTLRLTAELNVRFPEAVGNNFFERQAKYQHVQDVKLATVEAGATYDTLWWTAILGGNGLVLVLTLAFIWTAHGLKAKALPTHIHSPDAGDTEDPA